MDTLTSNRTKIILKMQIYDWSYTKIQQVLYLCGKIKDFKLLYNKGNHLRLYFQDFLGKRPETKLLPAKKAHRISKWCLSMTEHSINFSQKPFLWKRNKNSTKVFKKAQFSSSDRKTTRRKSPARQLKLPIWWSWVSLCCLFNIE